MEQYIHAEPRLQQPSVSHGSLDAEDYFVTCRSPVMASQLLAAQALLSRHSGYVLLPPENPR